MEADRGPRTNSDTRNAGRERPDVSQLSPVGNGPRAPDLVGHAGGTRPAAISAAGQRLRGVVDVGERIPGTVVGTVSELALAPVFEASQVIDSVPSAGSADGMSAGGIQPLATSPMLPLFTAA